jgi:hypothetical protein
MVGLGMGRDVNQSRKTKQATIEDILETNRGLVLTTTAANGAALATILVSITSADRVSDMYYALHIPGLLFGIGLIAGFATFYLDVLKQTAAIAWTEPPWSKSFWKGVLYFPFSIPILLAKGNHFIALISAAAFIFGVLEGASRSAHMLATFPK